MIRDRVALIQRWIERLYDLDAGPPVAEFIVSRRVAAALSVGVAARGEALLVADGGGAIDVALFLDDWVLDGDERDLGVFAHAVEGVSHFVYVTFRGARGVAMTQLELELQAEVDKYLACAEEVVRAPWSLEGLFERATFRDAPGTQERERYEVANREAARFCRALEGERARAGNVTSLLPELRRFYRMGQRQKMEHIRRRAA
ncbi:MAG: hypothetical protein HYY84_06045 [Deltaproteobacteria bacterium]|nr:hypothetical protein [Deltaproteobacteria bacterium]